MLNKVCLIGNIGKSPEYKEFPNGNLLSFSVATTESFKDKKGDWVKNTEWHNISLWGKSAYYYAEKLNKGNRVYVEGKLKTDSYEKDGQKKYITKVVANTVKLLDRGENEANAPAPSLTQTLADLDKPVEIVNNNMFDADDIPF